MVDTERVSLETEQIRQGITNRGLTVRLNRAIVDADLNAPLVEDPSEL